MELSSRKNQTEGMEISHKMPQLNMEGVGARLEALRIALDMGKADFANSFGLDPSSYTKTAKGEKPLQSQHAFTISERWGVSMDFLYRGRLADLPHDLRENILKNLNPEN